MKKAYVKPIVENVLLNSEEVIASDDVVIDGDPVDGSMGVGPNPF